MTEQLICHMYSLQLFIQGALSLSCPTADCHHCRVHLDGAECIFLVLSTNIIHFTREKPTDSEQRLHQHQYLTQYYQQGGRNYCKEIRIWITAAVIDNKGSWIPTMQCRHLFHLKLDRLTEVSVMVRWPALRRRTCPAQPVTLHTHPVLSWLHAGASLHTIIKGPFSFSFSILVMSACASARRCWLCRCVFLLTGVIIDAAALMERGECPWSVCPLSVMLLCWRGRGRASRRARALAAALTLFFKVTSEGGAFRRMCGRLIKRCSLPRLMGQIAHYAGLYIMSNCLLPSLPANEPSSYIRGRKTKIWTASAAGRVGGEQHRLVFAAQPTAPNLLLITTITHQPSRG